MDPTETRDEDRTFCFVKQEWNDHGPQPVPEGSLVIQYDYASSGSYSQGIGYIPESEMVKAEDKQVGRSGEAPLDDDEGRHVITFGPEAYEHIDVSLGKQDGPGGLVHELGESILPLWRMRFVLHLPRYDRGRQNFWQYREESARNYLNTYLI